MDSQRVIALLMVAAAAAYLGRSLVTSARDFFAAKSGCGGGCAKCAFAEGGGKKGERATKPTNALIAPQPNVIALSDIRTMPHRRS